MTRRRIEIDEEAKAEVRHAYQWYAAHDQAVADAFKAEVTRAIEILEDEADTFPIYDGDARRILLPNYPYGLVYELIGDVVFVIAVTHLKRRPGYWRK